MERKNGKATIMIAVLLMTMTLMANRLTIETTEAKGSVDSSTTAIQKVDSFSPLSTPPQIEWNKTYGGINNDGAYSVVKTNDGGYALAGFTSSFGAGLNDFYLVRTDPVGNMLWSKTYGGAREDIAHSVVQTSDGGYVVLGETNSFGEGNLYYIWLIKVDSNGNEQWDKTWSGSRDYYAGSVIQTTDGGYAIAGYTPAGYAFLIKTDSNGNTQWNKFYEAGYPYIRCVIQTIDGGYAMAGDAMLGPYGDFWLIKADSNGNLQWQKGYDRFEDKAYSVVQTPDGGYAIAGRSYSPWIDVAWLIKTDSSGNARWNKTYYTRDWGVEAYSLIRTVDNGFAMAGIETNSLGGVQQCDGWIAKTDASGNLQWNKAIGRSPYWDVAYSILQTLDGGYALAGVTYSYGAGGCDFWLVKLAGPSHDVSVANITPSKTVVGQGYSMNVNVTVANQGDYTETFDVTLYANTTTIETKQVTLTSGNSTTLIFSWGTTGFAKGNYTISAYAWPVEGEIDTTDNTFIDGWIVITIVGDVNGDSQVDLKDVFAVALAFGSYPGHPKWNPNLNIDNDLKIDLKDYYIVCMNYGKVDP